MRELAPPADREPYSDKLNRSYQTYLNFSCTICEILFDSSMLLEHHKDAYDHWSDADVSESEDEDDVYGGACYYADCDGGRSGTQNEPNEVALDCLANP